MLSPAKEWRVIAEEKRNVKDIFLNYLLPFLLLTMVACYIGYGIVGSKQDMFGLVASEKLGFHYAEYYALLIIISILISTLTISFIAPFFQANKSFNSNFKLMVYSYTASMTATILLIIPALSPLFYLAGIYNLVLLYSGLTRMTNVAPDKKKKYFITLVAALVFVFFSVSKILFRILID